ncbi:MAG TPA: Xaa-Pro peptidase family protein [Acidimicrobiia bacterium]|nr:Xaa-Pro peptidase family protein [Acidimicrobiia bacterium]
MTSAGMDFGVRMERAQAAMKAAGIDALLVSVGPDLPYLTGYEAMPLERLTMLVLTSSGASLVVPRLEAPRVAPGPFETRPWRETEDPVDIVAGMIRSAGSVAIGDHTWSVFLLGLQERLNRARFSSATPITSALRMRKERAEIELLRRAARATDRVAARLVDVRMSGMTERQLSRVVGAWTVEEGHDVDTFKIVASGPNGASPHHEPTDRVIEEGDMVVIDFGGRLAGYCSDMTRMFVVGQATPEQAEVHDVVQVAQRTAVDAVQPGAAAAEIDEAARSVIEEAGYGDHFIHRTGHGIGLEGHEEPYIIETNQSPVEPGMAFSIEPGIYLPGRFGVRIEDIVVVTEDGVEPLNRADHELITVE